MHLPNSVALANGTLLALVEGNLVELVVNSSGAYTATTIDTNVQSFTISSNGLSFTDKHPTSFWSVLAEIGEIVAGVFLSFVSAGTLAPIAAGLLTDIGLGVVASVLGPGIAAATVDGVESSALGTPFNLTNVITSIVTPGLSLLDNISGGLIQTAFGTGTASYLIGVLDGNLTGSTVLTNGLSVLVSDGFANSMLGQGIGSFLQVASSAGSDLANSPLFVGIGDFLQQAETAGLNLANSPLAVGIGNFLQQAESAGLTLASSPLAVGIGNFLQQADSAALNLASSQFAQGVGSFLNQVVSSGLAGSAFVQQQIVVLTGMASAGATNSAAAQGLVGFLNNVYFGGLTSAPFAGANVTSAQAAADGTVWFTCDNGLLGYAGNGQSAVAVEQNNVPVQITSFALGSNGTAWFVTTNGQLCHYSVGQNTVTPDQVARFMVSASGSVTAGTAAAVTVAAQDASGNVIADYTGSVQFSSSDQQAGLPANYTFSAADLGSHTFSIVLKTSGSQAITATAGSVSGQAAVQVAAAAATNFVVSAPVCRRPQARASRSRSQPRMLLATPSRVTPAL